MMLRYHLAYLQHTNGTEDLVHKLERIVSASIADTNRCTYRYTLVASLHKVILSADDDLARKMIHRKEQAADSQPDECRDAKQLVQKDSSDYNLQRRVDEREQVPCKLAHAVNVRSEECHGLCLGQNRFRIFIPSFSRLFRLRVIAGGVATVLSE